MFFPGIGEKKQDQSWLGRLSAFLPGAEQMTEQERMALIRQGLLAFGANTMANNSGNYGKAGPAIGAGLAAGMGAMNKGAEGLSEQKHRQQIIERQLGDPAGVREFNMMTQGLSDEERERARRVALGIEGRASSAGYGFDMVPDAYGIPRPQRMNPRTGAVEQYAAEIGQWVPLDDQMPSAPNPRADYLGLADQYGAQITSLQRSPEQNRAVGGVPNSQHINGTAGDFVVPPQAKPQFIADAKARGYEVIDEGDHVHVELPTFKPAPVAGLGRGRRKEDEARAVKAAEKSVELSALPAELQMRTQAAIEQAAGSVAAEAGAEAAVRAPEAIVKADETIALLDKALSHPGRATATGLSGVIDPRNYIPGSDARDFSVLLDQLGGRAFLEAFESLKGGGQITQVEGQKATEAMARLNTAQSDEEFEAALRELRGIAQNAKARAEGRLAGEKPAPRAANVADPFGIL